MLIITFKFEVLTDSLLKLDVYLWDEQCKQGIPITIMPRSLPIDTLSFVDWWLIHELCMNAEPNGPRSCYVRITSSDTLKAGPVWDFDMAFNEVGVDDGGDLRPEKFKYAKVLPPFLKNKQIRWLTTDSLYCANALLLNGLIGDPHIRSLSRKRWNELRPRFKRLNTYITHCGKLLKTQAERDQTLWNSKEPARFDPSVTWDEAIKRLLTTYNKRISALDAAFNK